MNKQTKTHLTTFFLIAIFSAGAPNARLSALGSFFSISSGIRGLSPLFAFFSTFTIASAALSSTEINN